MENNPASGSLPGRGSPGKRRCSGAGRQVEGSAEAAFTWLWELSNGLPIAQENPGLPETQGGHTEMTLDRRF